MDIFSIIKKTDDKNILNAIDENYATIEFTPHSDIISANKIF